MCSHDFSRNEFCVLLIKKVLIYTRSHTSTPQAWFALNNNEPVDFQPWSGDMTIRVTRRKNAATINPLHIYDLNLYCLYDLFNLTAHTRNPALPAKSLICNDKLDNFLSFVIGSQAAILNSITVSNIVDALVSIQELTHHLSIQEMDFAFYDTRDPIGDQAPNATGYAVSILLLFIASLYQLLTLKNVFVRKTRRRARLVTHMIAEMPSLTLDTSTDA